MTWSLQQARETYAISHWSDGYFDIDAKGRLIALPRRDPSHGRVPLLDIASAAEREGLSLPVLVRFTDMLQDRVIRLCAAFAKARGEFQYQGRYTPVYPIKVNQQRSVVEAILHAPVDRIGLEAGSKPELLALLAIAPRGTTIICNGYKDRAYVRLALIGRQLGLDVSIVVEKFSELALILEESAALAIEPRLGVRLRLASVTSGKWQNSGGEKSKFGLTPSGVLSLVETLRRQDALHWLTLMHFHVGSQVTDIQELKNALREAARYYAELRQLNVPIRHVDGGGGLGVDYEGTHSDSFCSVNYTLEEYAHTLVQAFAEICAEQHLPHPDLITESGRALTAHHAVLITNVIEVETAPAARPCPDQHTCAILQDLHRALQRLDQEDPLSIFHDAWFDLQTARTLFIQGKLGLAQLAEAENLGAGICRQIRRHLDVNLRAHRELLDQLNDRLADKIFCNFSVFQSMPDAWAIDQIFPVVPLQRLNEAPKRRGRIMDLTCDSDGTLKYYVDGQRIETTLPVHELAPGERYLLGFFLVGAYQEILGDMHNLFGDTHSVNVRLDDSGNWRLQEPLRGDHAADLLRYVHIYPEFLQRGVLKKLAESDLPPPRRKQYETELISGLNSYTYLEEP